MELFQEQIILIIASLIGTILTGIVSIGFAFLMSKIKSDKVNNALSNLQIAVKTTVGELQNNFVDEWKSISPHGTLTEKQIKELKDKYIYFIFNRIDKDSLDVLNASFENLNEYIHGMVDNFVNKIKKTETKYK